MAAVGLLGTSQDRLYPGHKLARRERLGYVVVGAHLQAEDLVDLTVTCRKHQYRNLSEFAQSTTGFYTVNTAEIEVEQHDGHRSHPQSLDCLFAGEGMEKPEAVALEEGPQHVSNGIVVFDKEDRFGWSGHRHSLV